jgi:hypothetical protein
MVHRRHSGGGTRYRRTVAVTALLAIAAACVSNETENIDVREQAMVYAGRVQVHPPQIQEEARRKGVGLGAEFAFQQTGAEFTTPTGLKEYDVAVFYSALMFEARVEDFRFMVKGGAGHGDFRVDGQMRTLREDGLGGMFGFEVRYAMAPWAGVFTRGTFFSRSSWDSLWGEIGVELRPTPTVGVQLAYVDATDLIEEDGGFLSAGDRAEVETQGLLLGLALHF